MYTIITDRIFWIYFIIALFFIIIGVGLIMSSTEPNIIAISIIYLISILALLIIVYYAHILNSNNEIDNNYINIFINVIYLSLLIVSTLWAAELNNLDGGPLRTISGILILLGGLLLFSLTTNNYDMYTISYWIALMYIIIWISLTLYVIIPS